MINVVIVFPKLEDAKNIRNLLVRNGYQVVGICSSGAQALQLTNRLGEGIVISGYKINDMLYSELHENLPSHFQMLLIASKQALSTCMNNDIICLSLPIRAHDLMNTLELMIGTMIRRRKKQKFRPKERTEEEKTIITSAKRLLIERNNMTEDEAHRYIQKCSMDSGNSLVESAKMVFTLMKY